MSCRSKPWFLRIRKVNVRSIKAAEKLPYVTPANETRRALLEQIGADVYNLYEITKDNYTLYTMRHPSFAHNEEQRKEA